MLRRTISCCRVGRHTPDRSRHSGSDQCHQSGRRAGRACGGICLLIFAGIGYLAYLDDNIIIGLIALSLGGVIFGFLRFNTHPASIFMGDAGSQFLGFSAIILSLALTQDISRP